jgi:hypothetical protein
MIISFINQKSPLYKPNMRLISVIARYEEDIDWLKDLKGNVIVYNKGSDNLNIPYIKSENIGRESETYCRFIVEWYEHLSNYDSVVFLQGNPFDHCESLFDKINSAKKDELVYLADKNTQLAYQNRRILNRMNNFVLNKILDTECDITYHESNDEATRILESVIMKNVVQYDFELCAIMGINESKNFYVAYGAQYIVPVEMIYSKSKTWWEDLLSLHQVYEQIDKKRNLPYILERTWPLIWAHEEIIYPHQAGK